MVSRDQIFFCFWLYTILISVASGVKIQLFRNYNYTGLIHESSSTEKCNNFSANEDVKSFTTDTCLVRYWHSNCKSTNSFKDVPGSYSSPAGQHKPFASFHVCNEEEGGSQLNVDITKYYEKDKPANIPAVLERYRQFCTCVNIPDYVQKMDKWSVNSHHNRFRAYFEPDCLENEFISTLFSGAQNDYTRNISDWTSSGFVTKSQYHILSIGPDKNSAYYKSSCQNYILLDQLTSKVSVLQESLRQAELKVTANQRNIGNMQTARRNAAVELINKNQAMERKFIEIEKSFEGKNQKLREKLEEKILMVETKLDDIVKNIEGKHEELKDEQAKTISKVELKLNDTEKSMEAKHTNLTHELVEKIRWVEDKIEKLKDELEPFLNKENKYFVTSDKKYHKT